MAARCNLHVPFVDQTDCAQPTGKSKNRLPRAAAPGLPEFYMRVDAFTASTVRHFSALTLRASRFRRFEFRGDIDGPNVATAVNSAAGREGWNVAPHLTLIEAQVEIHVREPSDGILPAILRTRLAGLDEQE